MSAAPRVPAPPPFTPPPPPPDTMGNPAIISLNNRITDGQITTNLYLMFIIGVICIVFFIVFRKGIRLYQTRLYLANVTFKPPVMKLTGHHRIWSWLVPIFTVSEEDLIRSCGLDSYMMVRLATLGVQLFGPVTIFALIVLFPTYTTQNYLAERHAAGDVASTSTPFSRATMGNLPRGSGLFWIPFFWVYVVVLYACWLLKRHYRAYVRLRARYIVRGEVSTNEWHEHFMRQNTRRASLSRPPRQQTTTIQSVVNNLTTLIPDDSEDTSSDGGWHSLVEASVVSRDGSGSDEERRTTDESTAVIDGEPAALRQRSLRRNSSLQSNSSGSPLLRKLATRRRQRSGRTPDGLRGSPDLQNSPERQMDAGEGVASPPPLHLPAAAQPPKPPAGARPPLPPDQALRERSGGGPALSEDIDNDSLTGGGDSVTSQHSNYVERMFNQRAQEASRANLQRMSSTRSAQSVAHEAAPSLERMGESDGVTASEYAPSIIQQQTAGTSKYETGRDPEGDISSGVVVYKWWQGERDPHGHLLSGKPNVWARKVVNTQAKDGRTVGVMAQQYVVLVEGVPDPAEQLESDFEHSWLNRILRKARRRKAGGSKQASPPPVLKSSNKGAEIEPLDNASVPREASTEIGTPAANGKEVNGGNHRGSTDSARSGHVAVDIKGDSGIRQPNHVTASEAADAQASTCPQDIDALAATGKPADGRDVTIDEDSEHIQREHKQGPVMTREEVVQEFFSYLFPDSFQLALPVLKHQEVDALLYKWDTAAKQLEITEATFEASECTTRPSLKVGGFCCCGGKQVDAINHWAGQVRELEAAVGEARQRALRAAPTASFFVFFNSQVAAATAAQASLQAEDGRTFRVSQAPGPEEVNWPTLWQDFTKRHLRMLLVAIPIVIMIIFPIGIFAGSVSQLTLLLCGSPSSTEATNVRWDWYCSGDNYLQKLFTGVVPPLVLTFWQGIVVPRWFYYWAQAERRWQSFTQLDQRILNIFYWWSVFSVFLGAMLGGSIFSQFRVALQTPSKIASIIGIALPTSSNFFINYVIVQALAIQPFRFMFPHMGVFPWVFRACGLCKPATKRVEIDRLWPHSARGSKEIAFMILVIIIGMAYAAVSPIILPVTLLYFLISWAFWRYATLYFFERCYESGGRMWERIFSQLVFTLFIFEGFTSAVFFANSAWYQGSIMLITLTFFLYQFHKSCTIRFGVSKFVPLESAAAAPLATVDPAMYVPPALRHGCAGWYTEAGKAWEAWGAAVYTL